MRVAAASYGTAVRRPPPCRRRWAEDRCRSSKGVKNARCAPATRAASCEIRSDSPSIRARSSQRCATSAASRHCVASRCATVAAAAGRRGLPSIAGRMTHIDASARRYPNATSRRGAQPRMPTLTEGAILDVLRTVQEPELGRDIVTLNMVKDIAIDGRRRRVHDRADDAGLPAQGRDRAQRRRGADRDRASSRSTSPGGRWSGARRRARPSSSSGRQERHRRRVGQGRRRQEHGQRQPRRRARPGRRQRSACSTRTSPARTSR